MYAVIASETPDTSEVEESTTNAYIAFAGTARAGERASVTIGTGDTGNVRVGSVTISYNNRLVQPGQLYYFFVRLYSSVVGDGVDVSSHQFYCCFSLSHSCRIKEPSVTALPGDLPPVSIHQNCRYKFYVSYTIFCCLYIFQPVTIVSKLRAPQRVEPQLVE